jgi:predicted Zn-dependent protease with MMP-like domain
MSSERSTRSRRARRQVAQRRDRDRGREFAEPDLYGLFDEPELLPAKVTVYRVPLQADFPDPEELEREIRITVLHELAHYFGIDEDRLEELGYG